MTTKFTASAAFKTALVVLAAVLVFGIAASPAAAAPAPLNQYGHWDWEDDYGLWEWDVDDDTFKYLPEFRDPAKQPAIKLTPTGYWMWDNDGHWDWEGPDYYVDNNGNPVTPGQQYVPPAQQPVQPAWQLPGNPPAKLNEYGHWDWEDDYGLWEWDVDDDTYKYLPAFRDPAKQPTIQLSPSGFWKWDYDGHWDWEETMDYYVDANGKPVTPGQQQSQTGQQQSQTGQQQSQSGATPVPLAGILAGLGAAAAAAVFMRKRA